MLDLRLNPGGILFAIICMLPIAGILSFITKSDLSLGKLSLGAFIGALIGNFLWARVAHKITFLHKIEKAVDNIKTSTSKKWVRPVVYLVAFSVVSIFFYLNM